LVAAAGFVGNGHFDQSLGKQRINDLVPELGAVRATGNGHQGNQTRLVAAFFEDFDLVPT
jgi:hypothetical protein